ncbi:MAG: hypothetical protein LRY73_07535 [Bacillus sp. (in: Bacteria)]|nr:hypothetical protein [Bacillus sp. (in: firmicutes)]
MNYFIKVGQYSKIKANYETTLLPEAWDQDLLETRQHLLHYQDKWWRVFSKDYRTAKKRVLGLHKNPKEKQVNLLEVVDSIMEARRLKNDIKENESRSEKNCSTTDGLPFIPIGKS